MNLIAVVASNLLIDLQKFPENRCVIKYAFSVIVTVLPPAFRATEADLMFSAKPIVQGKERYLPAILVLHLVVLCYEEV